MEHYSNLQSKVRGSKRTLHLPFSLMVLKACKKYGIDDATIRSLSLNDLLAIVVDFQIDEVEEYLRNQKGSKHKEVRELTDEEIYLFHM